MGTSQSSPGPGGGSPLVPPWADNQPQQPSGQPQQPSSTMAPARFKAFRQSMGRFITSGDQSELRSALGHYARKSTGGGRTAVRRLGKVIGAGGSLYDTLVGIEPREGEPQRLIDLSKLAGQPCDSAIEAIVQSLSLAGGDSDRIRISMNHALANALDGMGSFDGDAITDDIVIDTMINYVGDSIFQQIVLDGGSAWEKAESPRQSIRAEEELRELIAVIVDSKMAPMFEASSVRQLTSRQVIVLQEEAIQSVWEELEVY